MERLGKYSEQHNINTINRESGSVKLSILFGVVFVIFMISLAVYSIVSQPKCQRDLNSCLQNAQDDRGDKITLCMRSNESRRQKCSRASNESYFTKERRCHNRNQSCKRKNNVQPYANF